MSLVNTTARFAAVSPALVAICVVVCSCGPSASVSGPWAGDNEMEAAVSAYIAGDYGEATARLEALADKADTPEKLREVYWYLGRAYVATEEYSKAIDAFTAGKAHGGGFEFDEYLRRLAALVAGDPDNVARSERVTRAQLAVLIDRMFYGPDGGTAERPPQPGSAGSVEQLTVVARGVMGRLPDGDFHADAHVTRASFFAAVSRLITDRGIDVDTAELFAGGFAWALETDAEQGHFVTGKEVVATLRRVSAAQTAHGGQGS
jgi:hypothetical protein